MTTGRKCKNTSKVDIMMLIGSITAVLIILLILFWKIFISSLFVSEEKLSYTIKEKVFPQIIEIDKTIITLGSAAIVITVSLLKESTLVAKEFLLISWISFALSILLGILVLITYYSQRLLDNVLIAEFGRISEEEIKRKKAESIATARSMLKKEGQLVRILFFSIYLEASFLLVALVALVLFGIYNIK